MPSLPGRSPWQGVACVLYSLVALFYAALVHAACGCFGCLGGGGCLLADGAVGVHYLTEAPAESIGAWRDYENGDGPVPSAEFRVVDRWNNTAVDGGSARGRGEPITLTWGIIDDGTTITGSEGTSPSDLVAMMNRLYGEGDDGIESAPWFRLFEESFGRWSELSGVTYVYEPNDGGAAINQFTTPSGRRGVYADVRIGGHFIGGSGGGNTLAYNYFPDHADMVIDTDDDGFFGNRALDSRRLRNVLMHEAGHGLGFAHLESSNSGQLMEPSISTAFDGPQIDDILAAHRNYGDVLEKNGGNDSLLTAIDAGRFGDGESWLLGADGRARVVQPSMTDFVSIDGRNDVDYYRFEVEQHSEVQISVAQVGRTYNEGPQGGSQSPLITSELNELTVELLTTTRRGITVVSTGETFTRLETAHIIDDVLAVPGETYFVRVRGLEDDVQLYELRLSFTGVPIPEPAAVALALLGASVAGRPRDRGGRTA